MKIKMPIVFAAAAALVGACALEEVASVESFSTSDPSQPPENAPPDEDVPTTPPYPYPSTHPQIPKPPYWIPLCEITWDTFQGKYVDTGRCLRVSTKPAPNTCGTQVLANFQCMVGAADTPHNQCSNDVPKQVGVNNCFDGVPPPPHPWPEIPGGNFPRPDDEPDPDDDPSDPAN